MADLDTTGTVYSVPGVPAGQGTIKPVDLDWCDLDPFTQGAVMVLLGDLNREQQDQRLSADERPDMVGFSDLSREALARVMRDCREFQALPAFKAYAEAMPETSTLQWPDIDSPAAGGDFWNTRNCAGAGFWDGDWPKPHGDALATACDTFPRLDAYVGDDGKVYLT